MNRTTITIVQVSRWEIEHLTEAQLGQVRTELVDHLRDRGPALFDQSPAGTARRVKTSVEELENL